MPDFLSWEVHVPTTSRELSGTAPHLSNNPDRSGSLTWIFFLSFLFWIGYTLFMFYLYYEHKVRKQYPQYLILFLLSTGCVCRCLWFGFYTDYAETIEMQLLNRAAILLQFSAISMLLLMWSRALKVSHAIDQKALKRAEILSALATNSRRNRLTEGSNIGDGDKNNGDIDNNAGEDELMKSHMMRETIGNLVARTNADLNHVEIGRGIRTTSVVRGGLSVGAGTDTSELSRQQVVEARRNLRMKRYMWLGINVVAYGVILGTVAGNHNPRLWAINLTLTSFTCFIVAVGILYIGLRNWLRLRQELSSVYTTQGSGQQVQGNNASGVAARSISVNFFQHFGGRTSSVNSISTTSSLSSGRHSLTAVGGSSVPKLGINALNGAGIISKSGNGSSSKSNNSDSDTEFSNVSSVSSNNSRNNDNSNQLDDGNNVSFCQSVNECCVSCYHNYLVEFWIFLTAQNDGSSQRLQIQTEVLRTVLMVSFTVAIFFALRCYAFLYGPAIIGYFHAPPQPLVEETFYPWMYYQLPEFFPNLFIALGISPPKGIMRHWKLTLGRWLHNCFEFTCCVCQCICCRSNGDAGSYVNDEDDNNTADTHDHDHGYIHNSTLPPAAHRVRRSMDSEADDRGSRRGDGDSACGSFDSRDTDVNNRATQGFDFDPYRSRREEASPRGSVDMMSNDNSNGCHSGVGTPISSHVGNPMWDQHHGAPPTISENEDTAEASRRTGKSSGSTNEMKKSDSMFDFIKSILPGSSHPAGTLAWPTMLNKSVSASRLHGHGHVNSETLAAQAQADAEMRDYVYAISGFNPAYTNGSSGASTHGSSLSTGQHDHDDHDQPDWTENLDMFY